MSLGRDFRWLWSGNAAGNMADGIAFVAIPLTATTLTSNPALIAGLSLAYSLVRVLLVVPVGVIVDRVDRRLLMWAPNVIRGAIFLGVSVTFAVGAGDLLLLYFHARRCHGDRCRQRGYSGFASCRRRRRSRPREWSHPPSSSLMSSSGLP